MSLDTLFQQILLTEQQTSERTRQFQEVKVAIIKYQDLIKSAAENNERVNKELDEKNQQLSEMKLQHDLLQKRQHEMLKQMEELLQQQSQIKEHLEKVKRMSKEEQEKFMREIISFNNDFSLSSNGETVFKRQPQSEAPYLGKEVNSSNQEMESMSQRNSHLNSMQEEKKVLSVQLQGMKQTMRDLESQLKEARAVSESLRAESVMVSQKPLSDSTCLRLKKELEVHKEGELELLREALTSEIHFLQSKLSQRSPQNSRSYS